MVEYSNTIIKAITALLIILFGMLIGNIANNLIRKILRDIEINKMFREQLRLKIKFEEIFASIIKYFIYFVTVILALDSLGFSTWILQAILLIFALLIVVFTVLAFKDWLPNLISGFYIKKRKKIKKGDLVSISNVSGRVIKVNFIETKIETNNKEIVFIPNLSIARKYLEIKNDKGIRIDSTGKRRSK